MALIFHILTSSKNNNLNLGFRVGKFRDGDLLKIDFGFFSILPKKKYLSKLGKKNIISRYIYIYLVLKYQFKNSNNLNDIRNKKLFFKYIYIHLINSKK